MSEGRGQMSEGRGQRVEMRKECRSSNDETFDIRHSVILNSFFILISFIPNSGLKLLPPGKGVCKHLLISIF